MKPRELPTPVCHLCDVNLLEGDPILSASVYEGMFLLDSNRASSDWAGVSKEVQGILERHGAEVLASRQWDERRLAYPIRGHKKGTYLLTYFRIDGRRITEIEHDCGLNETILRALILKVHTKLADRLVAQALDPHAFQPAAVGAEVPAHAEERPRSRRRTEEE